MGEPYVRLLAGQLGNELGRPLDERRLDDHLIEAAAFPARRPAVSVWFV